MPAKIIDGKIISKEIRDELKKEISNLKKNNIIPGLGVILVGDDAASCSYVTAKERACKSIGIYSDDNRYQESISEDQLLEKIDDMNKDSKIHGILVQLPLPKHINSSKVLLSINPSKDVDGFHPMNVGKMMIGEKSFLPCTPHGILQMLKRSNININGANIVVIGRSNIVGKPVANMLIQKNLGGNATVTLCHTGTKNIAKHTIDADIVIVASGCPNTLTCEMVKPDAVVIDVGVNRISDTQNKLGYRLVGDTDFNELSKKVSAITPVPGGVGPMTITMLLFNTVSAAKQQLMDKEI